MNIANLTPKQLRRAAAIKEKIQSLENQLNRILGSPAKATSSAVVKPKRKMSAAARRKISLAAKARWVKIKAKK